MRFCSKENKLRKKIINSYEIINIDEYIDVNGMQFNFFYRSILTYFIFRLKSDLENIQIESFIKFNKNNIIKDNSIVLANEINSICIKSLIYDINKKRLKNELKGASTQERYNNYNILFKNKEFLSEFFEKYPVLEEILEKVIDKRLFLIKEIILRLINDKKEIEETFHFKFNEIISINITSGDTHNNGKKVSLVKINSKNLVYKPHSLATDIIYNKLIDFINNNCSSIKCIRYLKVLNKNTYGWQEFVKYNPCKTLEEVQGYFSRIGSILAILYSIGTTDIHFENIISSGENPYVIDLETLIENRSLLNNPRTVEDNFSIVLNSSVISTGILPMKLKNGLFDFDMSALCSEEEQKSDLWKINILDNNNTDQIKFKEIKGIITSNSNKVIFNNKAVNALDYQKFIIEGFTKVYECILTNKTCIFSLLEEYFALNNVEVRQVLRATSVYAKFLEASLHPKYLKDFGERHRILNIIKSNVNLQDENFKMQCEEEVRALINLDIPYFSANMNSKDLIANSHHIINNYYPKTLYETLVDNINKLSKSDLEKQLLYIRLSISTLLSNLWNEREESVDIKINYFNGGNSFLKNSISIGDFLVENAIWNDSKSECTWIAQLIDGKRIKLGMSNYTLYEYGGTIAFLITLSIETGEEKYFNTALGAIKTIERYYDNKLYEKKLSAYDGIGSLIYLYYKIYTVKKDYNYYLKYKKLIQELRVIEIQDNCIVDYVGGLSGLVVLLCNIYEYEKDDSLLKTIIKLSKKLLEKCDECNLTGLAHGYSGIILALSKISNIFKYNDIDSDKYIDKIKRLILIENKYYDNEIKNWLDLRKGQQKKDNIFWCHGLSGILLSRVKLLEYDFIDRSVLENDIENSLEKLFKYGFTDEKNHSLCHGIFGNIDVLLNVGDITNNIKLIERAKIEAINALEYMKNNKIKLGISSSDLMSFMLGLSGIAYALLRLNNLSVPSLLLLDI
ncbi:MAG: type 2 lanthipeptide synthetase LanM family protein [Clostridium sp.]